MLRTSACHLATRLLQCARAADASLPELLRAVCPAAIGQATTHHLNDSVGRLKNIAKNVAYEPMRGHATQAAPPPPTMPHSAGATSTPPPSAPPPPVSVMEVQSMQDFQAVLQLSQRAAVILDAYATWCGPCKQLDPVLHQAVAATQGAVVLTKLDIDRPALAPLVAQMQIASVPTLFLIFNGKLLDSKQGVPPQQELVSWINEIAALTRESVGGPAGQQPRGGAAGPSPDQLLGAAWDAVDSAPQNPLQRRQLAQEVAPLLGQVLQADSGATAEQKAAAWAGMAVCALLEGNVAGAMELVGSAKAAAPANGPVPDQVARAEAMVALAEETAALPEGTAAQQAPEGLVSKDLDALYAQALRHFAAGQPREAVEAALAIVRQDRDWNEQAGKRLALRLFDALGRGNELGTSGRRRLSNLWFI